MATRSSSWNSGRRKNAMLLIFAAIAVLAVSAADHIVTVGKVCSRLAGLMRLLLKKKKNN